MEILASLFSSNNAGMNNLPFLLRVHTIDSGSLAGLRKLILQNVLTSDANVNATVLDTFVKALATHCHCLKTLDLSQNNLGVATWSIHS